MKGQTNHHILQGKLQRRLRNNATDAERLLWRHLRGRQLDGCKFRRQHPFADYVLDFACLERMVVVELDGGQHAGQVEADELRSVFLRKAGFRVLRFWNNQVFEEMDGVLEVILRVLWERRGCGKNHPHPNPPLEGEGAGKARARLEGEGAGKAGACLEGEGAGKAGARLEGEGAGKAGACLEGERAGKAGACLEREGAGKAGALHEGEESMETSSQSPPLQGEGWVGMVFKKPRTEQ